MTNLPRAVLDTSALVRRPTGDERRVLRDREQRGDFGGWMGRMR